MDQRNWNKVLTINGKSHLRLTFLPSDVILVSLFNSDFSFVEEFEEFSANPVFDIHS